MVRSVTNAKFGNQQFDQIQPESEEAFAITFDGQEQSLAVVKFTGSVKNTTKKQFNGTGVISLLINGQIKRQNPLDSPVGVAPGNDNTIQGHVVVNQTDTSSETPVPVAAVVSLYDSAGNLMSSLESGLLAMISNKPIDQGKIELTGTFSIT